MSNDSAMVNIGILVLRIGIGVIFAAHGMQKLFGSFEGPGINGVAGMMRDMGMTPPIFWAWILALVEFVGGIFILLGILPRISAVLISIIMLVAITKIQWPNGFFMSNNGYEYQFLIFMACLTILLIGSGKYSVYNKF